MRISIAGVVLCGSLIAGPATAAGDQSGILTFQAFFQQLLSSLKIDSAQTNTSASQVTTTVLKSDESKISAVLESRVQQKIAEAKSRYSYETGQGYNACMVSVGMADIAQARADRATYAKKLGARDGEWLAEGGGSTNDTLSSIISLRKEVYCSDQESEELGAYCSTGNQGYDAGNTDASVWLAQRAYGAEEAMTGMDFVDTVAPLPTVPEKGVEGAEGALQRVEAIRSGVMRNAARSALQNIILDGMAGTAATE